MCETEARDRYPDRVGKAAERIQKFQPAGSSGGGGAGDMPLALMGSSRGGRGGGGALAPKLGDGGGGPGTGEKSGNKTPSTSFAGGSKDDEDGGELGKSCQAVIEIATEKLVGDIAQISKRELFLQT